MQKLLLRLWIVCTACCFAVPCWATAATHSPNILLLMAEDMSSRLGAFGDAVAHTPHLDALAQQGVRYTNVYTTAGVCAPSRVAHILGMHQISTGGQHMRTSTRPAGAYKAVPPAEVKAYPELLRRAGYYTYTDQKLDYQFSSPFPNSGPFTIWDSEGEANPDWHGRTANQPFYGFRNFAVTHESGVFKPLGNKPNSLMHFIMQVMRWWKSDAAVEPVIASENIEIPPYYPDTPTVRRDIARHYNNIAHMDKQVGQILAQLQADGLSESTIVIWTTDHGDGLPRAKRELHDSGIKVPMIIRWPEKYRPTNAKPGSIDKQMISFVDLAPTILTMAGVPLPDYLHGRSFATTSSPPRQYVFASRDRIDEVPDRQRAIRDKRFKYIRSWYPQQMQGHKLKFRDNIDMVREMRELFSAGKLTAEQGLWFEPAGEERLFDLQRDPHELNNLVNDSGYNADLIRLRAALDQRLAEIGDWSNEPESAMVARFMPNGEQAVTATPNIKVSNSTLTIVSSDAHASISYRLNDGGWQLYTGAVQVSGAGLAQAKAARYGWQESDTAELQW